MSVVMNEFRESIILLLLPRDGMSGQIFFTPDLVDIFQESCFLAFSRQKIFFLQMLENLEVEVLFSSKLRTFSRLVLIKAGSGCAHTFVCLDALGCRLFGVFRSVFHFCVLLEWLQLPRWARLAGC